MRLGLISDTHDRNELTRVAVEGLRGLDVDRVLHLGDITTPEAAALLAPLRRPVTFLRGNNDHADVLDAAMKRVGLPVPVDAWREVIAGVPIGATHGHKRPLLAGLQRHCRLVLRGHSHRAGVERVDGSLMVNPGALHRANVKSVATVDLPSLEVAFYEVRPGGLRPWAPPEGT